MVDDFEKKYKTLEIPYPKDNAQAEIATEEAKQKAAYEKFVTESKTRVEGLGTELAKVISNIVTKDIGTNYGLGYNPKFHCVKYCLFSIVGSYDANRRDEYGRSHGGGTRSCTRISS